MRLLDESDSNDAAQDNDAAYPSTQEMHSNPFTREFIDILKNYKNNRPHFNRFKADVLNCKTDLHGRNPNHRNYNIFHYMALVIIEEEDQKPFSELFDEIFQKAVAQSKPDFLFERVDYTRSNSSLNKLPSPEKKKAPMRPLDYAVINRAFYYVKLIVKKIIFENKDFKVENLRLTNKIFLPTEKNAIFNFTKNLKIANFIILQELLNCSDEFKNKLIEKENRQELFSLVERIFNEKLIEDLSTSSLVYTPSECSQLLIQLINDPSKASQRADRFLAALLKKTPASSPADNLNLSNLDNSLPNEYQIFTTFITDYFTRQRSLEHYYQKLKDINQEVGTENESLKFKLSESHKIQESFNDTQKGWLAREQELLQQQQKINQENEVLQTKDSEKNTLITKLSEELNTAKEKNKELTEITKEIIGLRQQLIQKDKDRAELLAANRLQHEKQMEAKTKELENNKKTISDLKSELINLKENHEELETKKKELQDALQESNNSVTKLTEDNKTKKRKIGQLESEKQEYQKKLKNSTDVVSNFFHSFSQQTAKSKEDDDDDEIIQSSPEAIDFEEEDQFSDPLKKNSEIYKFNVAEPILQLAITPGEAASLYFKEYKATKYNIIDPDVILSSSQPLTVQKNVSNVTGIWGEESIYIFLQIKYQFKYSDTEIKDKPYGFRVKGKISSENDYETISIKIKVEFPNKGKYEQLISGQSPELSKIPYDFKITKIYSNSDDKKTKYIDGKATPKNNAYAFFTKNEHEFMKNNTDNFKVYRITNAGNDKTQCEPKKAKDILDEFESGTSDYQLMIKM